ncbi:dihydrofolate reductase family protein [Lapillicoccus jejuensis]|uniref:Dihydrofolate reductase n=1 Tax=Lapillicoccus jejuensis TaxID=402171 RepID=A0A542DYV3_9MICO|nr:dihydrofolate reductase family protein [Lapillicoccus jejuensis]TQJ08226.1 dihydrofolate reductase [Lapillicoccus jejuensis]
MGRLLYATLCSLDGYVADEQGDFSWCFPTPAAHQEVNDLLRPVTTNLYGRRMYDVMSAWEDMGRAEADDEIERDFARLWRASEKVVYSSTLEQVSTPRTRLERRFDPAAVREFVEASDGDVSVGGPTLAAAALTAGIVDEVSLFVVPVSVGDGLPVLPRGRRLDLRLLDEERLDERTVRLRYAAR